MHFNRIIETLSALLKMNDLRWRYQTTKKQQYEKQQIKAVWLISTVVPTSNEHQPESAASPQQQVASV